MIRHHAPASPRRRTVGLLLCAMLLMQAFGLLHGVVHAAGPPRALHEGASTPSNPTGFEGLFAHHDDTVDCQVFDSLSHADAPRLARLVPGVEHPPLPRLRARPQPQVAARASGISARGPPALT